MERILPGGDRPGAADSHAIGYADWLFARPAFAKARATAVAGVALLDSIAQGTCGRPFAACSAEERDAAIARLEEVPHPTAQRFFADLVLLTVTGFLCAPRYGGNRGGVGWEAIGFVPHPHTEGAAR